jgi:hypothetical protein
MKLAAGVVGIALMLGIALVCILRPEALRAAWLRHSEAWGFEHPLKSIMTADWYPTYVRVVGIVLLVGVMTFTCLLLLGPQEGARP